MNSRLALILALLASPLPAAAGTLTLGSGWQSDFLTSTTDPTTQSPWTFVVTSGAHLSLTDCCNVGDIYTLSGDINGVTVVGAGANDIRADGTGFGAEWLRADLGKFTTYVGPGTYTFEINGNGAGGLIAELGVRLDASVPEPATWALLITGFGMVGAAMRRRAPAIA
jgi:hypothetical protein